MCATPDGYVWIKRGPKWVKMPKPCGSCWQCKENYVNDWVGRCLAEAATAVASVTLSLTYATPKDPLDFSHRVVNPHHFQLFMKRLRKAGHKVRYLVAGEYGELFDRAHFHAILFFKELKDIPGAPPRLENRAAFALDHTIAAPLSRKMPDADMVHIREWPHGHVVTDWSCSERAVRYCCEYLYEDGKKTNWFSMSKKPPLGFEWFAAKAARNIELDVLPSTFEYLPPGGKPGKVYLMTGATRREYLNHITKKKDQRARMSRWVRTSFDKIARDEFVKSRREAPVPPPVERSGGELTPLGRLQQTADHVRIASTAFQREELESVFRFAKMMGFDDVESFQKFKDAVGPEQFSAAFRNRQVDVSGEQCSAGLGKRACKCSRCSAFAARAEALRKTAKPPRGFDRQGVAFWVDPDADYLGTPFAREDVDRPDYQPGEDGSEDG